MEIKSFIIENSDADLFDTELKFYIASARASGSVEVCNGNGWHSCEDIEGGADDFVIRIKED